jgi:hypothetical protein
MVLQHLNFLNYPDGKVDCRYLVGRPKMNPMKLFICLIFTLLSIVPVLAQGDWKKIENDHFSFSVPSSFKKTSVHGIDSFVEEYLSNNIELTFDYGRYSNNFGDWPEDTKFDKVTIDGRSARIGIAKQLFRKGFPYSTQVYFKLDQYTALSMFAACKSEKDVAVARKIFTTIAFKPRDVKK